MSKNDKSEVATLKAQIAALEQQVVEAKKVTETQFRTVNTKTANNFHVAYNQLVSAEFVKANFADFLISHDSATNCDVYSVELKDALKTYILSKINA